MAQITKMGEAGALGTIKKEPSNEMQSQSLSTQPLGAVAIWGYLFLMYLPIAGWIVALCFAFSKKGNQNRRSLARATLINKLILLIITALLGGIAYITIGGIVTATKELLNNVNQSTSNITNLMEQFTQYKQILEEFLKIFG